MKLYIIRHGETPWNTELRLQGQTDIELNENGRALARKAAEGMKGISLDLVISSPLVRAVETARIILDGIGHGTSGRISNDSEVPLLMDERIREIGFGAMEGQRFRKDLTEEECPEYYCFFHAPDRYVPVEGGERLEELLMRTGAFLDELRQKKEWYGKSILISTHGAASRALLANVTHADRKDFWGSGVPKNCAVSVIEYDETEDNWKVKELDRLYYENI